MQDGGVPIQKLGGECQVLVETWHEGHHGSQSPGHGGLGVEAAEEEATLPRRRRHCTEGHDALLAALLHPPCVRVSITGTRCGGDEGRKLPFRSFPEVLTCDVCAITQVCLCNIGRSVSLLKREGIPGLSNTGTLKEGNAKTCHLGRRNIMAQRATTM